MKKRILAVGAVVALSLTACGGGNKAAESKPAEGKSTGTTLMNCGVELDYSTPAKRIVALEQGAIDTALDLAGAEKLVGYSHKSDNVDEKYRADFAKIPELSPKVANAEQIRSVEPDLIYSPFLSAYTKDGSGERAEWKGHKVNPFLTNTECRDEADNEGKTNFELLEKDFEQLGKLTGNEAEATKLINEQREAIDYAKKHASKDKPTFAVIYSSYDGAPYVAGKLSIAQEMIEAIGGMNVYDDVNDTWPEVQWETLSDKNPDYLILVDLPVRGRPGDTWQEKKEILAKETAVSKMDAVKNERYIAVNASGLSPASTSMKSLRQLVDGFLALQK